MNKTDKIFVAGHRGLVGSAIWKNLESKGYTNLIARTRAELDLRNQPAVEAFFAYERPDYVFLAAAKVGGIMANNTYRGEFIYENLMVQSNVIHQAYMNGVKKLLFLGSTCIYPKEAPQPLKEEYLLSGKLETTNEPYAIAKIAGIKMCEAYNQQYGTNFISVMPTNLYGPNDNFDLEKSHVLPALLRRIHLGKLLEQGDYRAIEADLSDVGNGKNLVNADNHSDAAKKEKLEQILADFGVTRQPSPVNPHHSEVTVEIWGSGQPMREFLWSEDMADACTFLMESYDFKSENKSQEGTWDWGSRQPLVPFLNIGTGEEISIRDLASLIKSIVNFQGNLVFNSLKPDGTLRKVTDVTRLHSLGWHHQVNLPDGIRRLCDWYQKNAGI